MAIGRLWPSDDDDDAPTMTMVMLFYTPTFKQEIGAFKTIQHNASKIYFKLFFPKVWMITIIGTTFGIPDTVMGLTFIAAGVGLIIAIIIFIISIND